MNLCHSLHIYFIFKYWFIGVSQFNTGTGLCMVERGVSADAVDNYCTPCLHLRWLIFIIDYDPVKLIFFCQCVFFSIIIVDDFDKDVDDLLFMLMLKMTVVTKEVYKRKWWQKLLQLGWFKWFVIFLQVITSIYLL